MGLVLVLFIVPVSLLWLTNLFFYVANLQRLSGLQILKAICAGGIIAVLLIAFVTLQDKVYIFSFVLNTIVLFSVLLIWSLITFVKRDKKDLRWGLLINTSVLTFWVIMGFAWYLSSGLDKFHY